MKTIHVLMAAELAHDQRIELAGRHVPRTRFVEPPRAPGPPLTVLFGSSQPGIEGGGGSLLRPFRPGVPLVGRLRYPGEALDHAEPVWGAGPVTLHGVGAGVTGD
jgi:hypothetical protein